mmetsp:Transcript_96499/g.152655  ORF Transcript_96499/g.152655 Transcript_96499/m.152655 type:complete len:86 (-) Transcript_96499:988-1245(-)
MATEASGLNASRVLGIPPQDEKRVGTDGRDCIEGAEGEEYKRSGTRLVGTLGDSLRCVLSNTFSCGFNDENLGDMALSTTSGYSY